jgi:hypothetical protein
MLVLPLAKEVSTILFRAWLNDRPLPQDAALGMNELVEAATDKYFDRRSLRRQFEQIADRIAAQLAPLLASEFSGVPENEVAAVVLLTEDVLRESKLTAIDFARLDSDPQELEKLLRKASANKIHQAQLSTSGTALFDLLLRETSNYLVDLVVRLPPFQSAAAQEMLRRESRLFERVDEVFDQLPQAPAFLGGTVAGAAATFETEYRRALARGLDEIELFGLDLPEYRRRYNLNVAYISLVLDLRQGREGPTEEGESEAKSLESSEAETDGEGEEGSRHSLEGVPRALITGEAGSGKTTLLQWLAVKSCQGKLHSWGDPVPFFIPLRRSADGPLPAPEEFVAGAAPQLAGVMPPGWTHDVLADGRGLVLVDGVDELPPERRADVRRWVSGLVETFPTSRFIVTSRPPAVEEGWLDDRDFVTAELQPMSFTDISNFIDHWHKAAVENPQNLEERAELEGLSESLQELIRRDRAVRSLATSPLLCAMLCALHRDRKSHLPRGRLEVYRVALEGLVDRRDVEREVATGLPAQSLSLPEKLVLLRDLSYWLLVNGHTDAAVERCADRVRQKLNSMPHISYSAEEVFAYLLTRSGVLREPVPGRIDFLHRTFQEYLAAAEIIEQDNVGQLVALADSDEWREVTILAAGQARREQRELLLDGLLTRGREEPEKSHRFYLLAIACLDASVEMSPQRTKELKEILAALIPPRNMTDAIALASAGELAVPQLGAGWQGAKARTTAACVRSLGLIGGDLSLSYLEKIAPDARTTVGKEIVRMWDQFDPEQYARAVLSQTPMFEGRNIRLSPERARFASYFKGLAGLRVEAPSRAKSDAGVLEAVANCPTLTKLVLVNLPHVELDLITDMKSLQQIGIQNCTVQSSPDTLKELPDLSSVDCRELEIEDLRFLQGLPHLRHLLLWRVVGDVDLSSCVQLDHLQTLELHDLSLVGSLVPLSERPLKHLRITKTNIEGQDLVSVDWNEALESLILDIAPQDQSRLLSLPSLREAEFLELPFQTISCDSESGIQKLFLGNAQNLISIDDVVNMPLLEYLSLRGAKRLSDIGPLRQCRSLRGLDLSNSAVTDLSPLVGLEKLERLSIRLTDIQDLSVLRELPNLRTLIVGDTQLFSRRKELGDVQFRVVPFGVAVSRRIRGLDFYPSMQSFTR